MTPRPLALLPRAAVLLAAPFALALTVAGCDGGANDGDIVEVTEVEACTNRSDCGEGLLCVGGTCLAGQCDPALTQDDCQAEGADDDPDVGPYCCKAYQLCGFDRRCGANPDAPVGSQCEANEDCPDPGQFCSGGTCYDSGNRTPCTASFQCTADERCDRTVFLCVPDEGGCTFCGEDFPELCCEEDQNCDLETGFCIEPGGQECTPDTVEEDCRSNQLCNDQGQCVQCIDDDDCGPGTACNTGTGSCYSVLNACDDDDDCNPPKRCSPAASECVTPQCEGDAQCQADDARTLCDLNTFTCYLPAAECDEDDEPNNGVGSATDLGGLSGAGTLCRGDVDYVRFPVQPNKRYRATVSFPDFNVGGNAIAILDGSGSQVDSDTYSSFENSLTVTAITGVDETDTSHYIRITGSGGDGDLWAYSIEIEELEAPEMVDCSDEIEEGIEPNDSFEEAHEITAPGTYTFVRCDQADKDYFHVTVPPQNGIDVTVEFDNAAGDMAVRLFDGPSDSDSVSYSDGAGADIESVEAPEGATEFWFRVALWSSTASGVDGQPYTVTVNPVPRPEECEPDVGEPGDDEAAGAQTLALDTTTPGTRCVAVDTDWYTFTVPANFGGSLGLGFEHSEGDLRLDLYDDEQTLIDSSNSSSSSEGGEAIEIPFAAEERTYLAEVRLHTGSGDVAQEYTITASTYDASVCVASEPSPNNGIVDATCVGADLLTEFPCESGPWTEPVVAPAASTCDSAPGTEGCGTVCGVNDEDWYRVGKLNDGQALSARLRYDPGTEGENGQLGLLLVRGNQDLSSYTTVAYAPNNDLEGDLSLSLNAPTVNPAFAREYAVVVRPEGTEGFSALPYRLDIDVGDPCIADAAESNEDPSESTILRADGQPGVDYDETLDRTLCGYDTDVYELFAFVGETLTVHLGGPPDVTVDIGSRPADITDPAPTVSGGEGQPVIGPCPVAVPGGQDTGGETDGGVVDSDAGSADGGTGPSEPEGYSCVTATYTSSSIQQLYLTVKRTSEDVASIGPYNLQVIVDSP